MLHTTLHLYCEMQNYNIDIMLLLVGVYWEILWINLLNYIIQQFFVHIAYFYITIIGYQYKND